jgi:hypothetical protein
MVLVTKITKCVSLKHSFIFLQTESLERVTSNQVHRLLPHIPQKFYRLGKSQKAAQLLAMVKNNVAKEHPVIIFR